MTTRAPRAADPSGAGYVPPQRVGLTAKDLGFKLPPPPKHPWRTQNHGPSNGYDSREKEVWRDVVWERLVGATPPTARPTAHVFLIESLDGLEIEKALRLGFTQERLHVCNGNPAIVATLKRRYPLINTYGVEAERALLRIAAADIELRIISLDFCSCLSSSVIDTLRAARCAAGAFASMAINVLRGREPRIIGDTLRAIADDTDGWMKWHDRRRSYYRFPDRHFPGPGMDAARHILMFIALCLPPTQDGTWWGTDERGELGVRCGPGPARRGFITAAGQYDSHLGHQTMGWVVMDTMMVLDGLDTGVRAQMFSKAAKGLCPAPRADRKALGDRR